MPIERINKVAEAIKQEVAQILQQELKDPRIGFITVTRVKVTPDLRHATVYYSLLEGQSAEAPGAAPPGNRSQSAQAPGAMPTGRQAAPSGNRSQSAQAPGAAPPGNRSQSIPEDTKAGLKSGLGFIRRLLGDRLRLRVTPELLFRLDASIEESIRMSKLLDELNKPGQK